MVWASPVKRLVWVCPAGASLERPSCWLIEVLVLSRCLLCNAYNGGSQYERRLLLEWVKLVDTRAIRYAYPLAGHRDLIPSLLHVIAGSQRKVTLLLREEPTSCQALFGLFN